MHWSPECSGPPSASKTMCAALPLNYQHGDGAGCGRRLVHTQHFSSKRINIASTEAAESEIQKKNQNHSGLEVDHPNVCADALAQSPNFARAECISSILPIHVLEKRFLTSKRPVLELRYLSWRVFTLKEIVYFTVRWSFNDSPWTFSLPPERSPGSGTCESGRM